MKQCAEALRHGPADAAGRCPWCRAKITYVVPMPRAGAITDLSESYGQTYDPDFGALSPTEIRRRYRMGQEA